MDIVLPFGHCLIVVQCMVITPLPTEGAEHWWNCSSNRCLGIDQQSTLTHIQHWLSVSIDPQSSATGSPYGVLLPLALFSFLRNRFLYETTQKAANRIWIGNKMKALDLPRLCRYFHFLWIYLDCVATFTVSLPTLCRYFRFLWIYLDCVATFTVSWMASHAYKWAAMQGTARAPWDWVYSHVGVTFTCWCAWVWHSHAGAQKNTRCVYAAFACICIQGSTSCVCVCCFHTLIHIQGEHCAKEESDPMQHLDKCKELAQKDDKHYQQVQTRELKQKKAELKQKKIEANKARENTKSWYASVFPIVEHHHDISTRSIPCYATKLHCQQDSWKKLIDSN